MPCRAECLVAAGRLGGTVSILEANTGAEQCCLPADPVPRIDADAALVRGLEFLQLEAGPRLFTCTAGGKAHVYQRGHDVSSDEAPSTSGTQALWRESGSFQTSKNVIATVSRR